MSEGRDEPIAWGMLEGAYGSAEEVGVLLDLIESGEEGWGDLIGQVLHQGSLYGATAPAISKIIGFLKQDTFSRQPSQRTRAFVFLSATVTAARQISKDTPISFDVLEALRKGCALYDAGVTDEEVEVRLASTAIWKSVADDRAQAFASIAKRYEHETECDVRVTMLSALNELTETEGEWRIRLPLILSSATSIREKFYAAAYLAVRQRDSTPDDVANQLAKSYANLPEAEHPVEVTNLEEPEDLYWIAIQAMGPSRGVACLAKTLEVWNDLSVLWDARKLLNVVELLLRLASNDDRRGWGGTSSSRGPKIQYFGVEPPSKDSYWLRSPEAKVALNAIANKAELWQIDTNLLGLFGLPSAHEELRELARGLPPPDLD